MTNICLLFLWSTRFSNLWWFSPQICSFHFIHSFMIGQSISKDNPTCTLIVSNQLRNGLGNFVLFWPTAGNAKQVTLKWVARLSECKFYGHQFRVTSIIACRRKTLCGTSLVDFPAAKKSQPRHTIFPLFFLVYCLAGLMINYIFHSSILIRLYTPLRLNLAK